MEFMDFMNLKNVELIGMTEPDTNSLRLYREPFIASEEQESLEINGIKIDNTFPIVPDEKKPIIRIDFNSYISYAITNESYTSWNDYEVFEGLAFRIYTKSRFLDFLKVHTFADDNYPGGHIIHYGIIGLNHIINIASVDKPKITEVKKSN